MRTSVISILFKLLEISKIEICMTSLTIGKPVGWECDFPLVELKTVFGD